MEVPSVKILIETSGGGGVVLLVVLALLAAGHGGGIGTAAAVALITAVITVVLAVAAIAVYLVRRGEPESHPTPIRHVTAERVTEADPAPIGQLTASTRRALEPGGPREVRLPPEQLAELAELLRRQHPVRDAITEED
jgi:hypothetical protein